MSYLEEIFTSIYNILKDNHLIIIDENTEEKKKKSFETFKSTSENLETCTSYDDEFHRILDKLFQTLNIDISMKEDFIQIYKKLVDELNVLKGHFNGQSIRMRKINEQQQQQIDALEMKYDSLQLKMLLTELKISAREAVYLFQAYFIKPILKNMKINSWSQLTDEWSRREGNVIKQLGLDRKDVYSDMVQQHPDIQKLISPIEIELLTKTNFPFKLINLRRISTERNLIAHINIRSVSDQRSFINELQNQKFPNDYEHSLTVQNIISCLSSLDMDQCNTQLHAIR